MPDSTQVSGHCPGLFINNLLGANMLLNYILNFDDLMLSLLMPPNHCTELRYL